MSLILLHSQWDKIKQYVQITFPDLIGEVEVEEKFVIMKRQACPVLSPEHKDSGKRWIKDGNWVRNQYLLRSVLYNTGIMEFL